MFWLALILLIVIVAFLRWNGSIGPRNSAHERIRAPARTVDATRLSQFQRLAEAELATKLAADGFQLIERIHHNALPPSREPYLEAKIGGTPLTVWIYLDGGNVSGPSVDRRFEDWDAESPEELASNFASTAAALARQHRDHAA
jgi:hypothetical protein